MLVVENNQLSGDVLTSNEVPVLRYMEFNGSQVREIFQKTQEALQDGRVFNRKPAPQTVGKYLMHMQKGTFEWYAQSTPVLITKDSCIAGGWQRWNAADAFCGGDPNKKVKFPVYFPATKKQIELQDSYCRARTVNDSAAILGRVDLGAFRPFTKATVGSVLKHLWLYKHNWKNVDTSLPAEGREIVTAHADFGAHIAKLASWCSEEMANKKAQEESVYQFWKSAPILIPLVWAVPYIEENTYKQFIQTIMNCGKDKVTPTGIVREWLEDWGNGKQIYKYGGNPLGWKRPFMQVLRCLYAIQNNNSVMGEWSDDVIEGFFGLA